MVEKQKQMKKNIKNTPFINLTGEYGFVEPLKSFVPSTISQIIKIDDNNMWLDRGKKRDEHKSLYFFELNSENKIQNLEQIKIGERIRDITIKDNKLFLF